MNVVLVWVGKTSKKYINEGINDFVTRIGRYHNFSIEEIAQVKNSEKLPPVILKKKEADAINKRLKKGDCIVLLDENGCNFKSVEFASFITDRFNSSIKRLVFIIGGAYGFDDLIKNIAMYKISLSKMTYSHQLIRLIFLEQLYRANTIIKNEPYHNN